MLSKMFRASKANMMIQQRMARRNFSKTTHVPAEIVTSQTISVPEGEVLTQQ